MMRLHWDSKAYYKGQNYKKKYKKIKFISHDARLLRLYNIGQFGLYKTRDLKIRVWRKDRYNTRDLKILNILTDWW